MSFWSFLDITLGEVWEQLCDGRFGHDSAPHHSAICFSSGCKTAEVDSDRCLFQDGKIMGTER